MRYTDKLKITRRRHKNHGYLKEFAKGGSRAPFSTEPMSWVFEDSAMIKGFLFVWWFGGKRCQLVVVTGGHGWWRRKF